MDGKEEKNKKKIIIQIRMSERGKFMLDSVCEKFGINYSEFIRGLIREKYQKLNPAYKKTKRSFDEFEEEMTPEQACEQAGGLVETVDGTPMCVFQMTKNLSRKVPLSKPELFEK